MTLATGYTSTTTNDMLFLSTSYNIAMLPKASTIFYLYTTTSLTSFPATPRASILVPYMRESFSRLAFTHVHLHYYFRILSFFYSGHIRSRSFDHGTFDNITYGIGVNVRLISGAVGSYINWHFPGDFGEIGGTFAFLGKG